MMECVRGASAPIAKGFESIQVLQHCSVLASYDKPYDQPALQYLLHCEPRQDNMPLRVVFQESIEGQFSHTAFKAQFFAFNFLRTEMKKPGLFITRAPGTRNHFILGILYEDNLLIIDPSGIPESNEIYTALSEISIERNLTVYLSSTKLLYDENNSVVSSGPLCIELAYYFLNLNLESFFKAIPKKVETKNGLACSPVDLPLPPSLQELMKTSTPSFYQFGLCQNRLSHYHHLESICRLLQEKKAIEEYIKEDCFLAHEQFLIDALSKNELVAAVFQYDSSYQEVKQRFEALESGKISPNAQKIKDKRNSHLPLPATVTAKANEHSVTSESPKTKIKSHLKFLRNLMLLSLLLIPFAHFFLWPYMASFLSVGIHQFLTASSTPWLLAGLSFLGFSSLIAGIIYYENGFEEIVPENKEPVPLQAASEEIDSDPTEEWQQFASPLRFSSKAKKGLGPQVTPTLEPAARTTPGAP